MKQDFSLTKIAGAAALAIGVSITAIADSNLVQLAPRYLDPLTFAKFDPAVQNQIFAFSYGYPQAYSSLDNGTKWRRVLNLPQFFEKDGLSHSIKAFKVGPGKDMVYFKANSSEPRGEGLFALNHRTGDLIHIQMPNMDLNSWIESFDVQDEDGKVIILHTGFRPDMFTLFSQVHYTKDGGQTWKLIYSNWEHEFVHPNKVAIAPDNPSRLYIMRNSGPSGLSGGLLISDDEGDTWHEVLIGYTTGPVAFNPNNPKEMYLGSWHMAPEEHLFHSLDGGETWDSIELPWSPFIYNNFTDIVFDPQDANNIIAAEENQLFVTADGFASATDAGWPELMFPNTVSINPFNPDDVIVGLDMYGMARSADRLQTIDSPYGVDQKGDYDCRSITLSAATPYFLRENELRTPAGYLDGDFTDYSRVIGVPSDANHVLALSSDGTLVLVGNQGTTEVLMKSVEAVSDVVKAAGSQYVVIDGALHTFGADYKLTKIADGFGAIAGAGNALVAVSGSELKEYDGSQWTSLPALSGEPTMLSLAADGTVAALVDNSVHVLRNGKWAKAASGCEVLSVSIAPSNSNFLVARKKQPNNLVSYIYTTDGGASWEERDETVFELSHAKTGAVAFADDGVCTIYLASNDMGALAYTLDPDFVAEQPETPQLKITEVRNLTAAIRPDGSCVLTWISPESHYSATYDVLRDGTTLATGIKEREYTDAALTTGNHRWTVVAHYGETNTIGASVEKAYTALAAPVADLAAEADNLINGDAVVNLTWATPEGYDAGCYTVWRDGEVLAEGVTANNYSDTGLSGGNHNWAVAAVYNGVESLKREVSLNVINNCAPVRNLDAWFDLDTKEVNLAWDAPGDLPKGWLSFCDEPASAYKPVNEDSFVFIVATYWTAEELERYGLIGARLTDITFVPGTERATYSPVVWIGGDEENPGDELVAKNLSGVSLRKGEWNTWAVPAAADVVEGKAMWVGYAVTYPVTEAPVGVDAAPRVAGRNKINPTSAFTGGWMSLEDYDRRADFNFCIGARFELPDGTRLDLRPMDAKNVDEKISYEVYRDGELVGTTTDNLFAEGDLDEQYYTYDVKAIHASKGEAPAVTTAVFGGNLCPAPTDIKLESDKGTVVLNWSTSAPQLIPATLLSETFDEEGVIPTGWTLGDKDGDGHDWNVIAWYGDETGFLSSDIYYYGETGVDHLSPDNWVITPRITVDGVNTKLVFNISSPGTYDNDSYYEVLVSTTGTDFDDFVTVDSGILTNNNNVWFKKVVDLSAYNGDIYIAFRHKNSIEDGALGMYIDNVMVTQEVEKARLYNVYRDGQSVGTNIAGNTFTDNTVTDGEHVWTVTAICDEYNCESNPLSVEATISDSGVTDAVVTETSVYYNRAAGTINVFTPEYAEREVTVWNVAGQLVGGGETDSTGRATIAAEAFGAGVYLVRVASINTKLIIQ
ncbi:MAG: hypothetical protein HDS78_01075 [Bacteroidales bacterium]|nr:hypothetical protein [Bacteroidales bacterium]